jgi:hypothetical protein
LIKSVGSRRSSRHLRGLKDSRELIRFDALHVLEGMGDFYLGRARPETLAKVNYWSLLGIALPCTWDVEHRPGVLFHRDKVVQGGGSNISWNGPGGDF